MLSALFLARWLAGFGVRDVCRVHEIGNNGNRLFVQLAIFAAEELRTPGGSRIVRPTLSVPVTLPDGDLREMSWGFLRKFKGARGPISRTIVNSREDKLDSAMWRQAFREVRCLIPAFALYECVEDPGGMTIGSWSRGTAVILPKPFATCGDAENDFKILPFQATLDPCHTDVIGTA